MDEKINDFINGITPSNYFITKSMEISKVNNSGTLWYTKKYLVLYDAIFLSKKIDTLEGINEIRNNFESYIATLPENQKEDAIAFFFPEHADIRGKFRTYNDFKGIVGINEDVNNYLSKVDKYYFVYLMNTGGQSGVKAYIKEHLYQEDFVVSDLERIIEEYKMLHSEENINVNGIISDYHASLRNERQILFYYGYFHSRNTGAGSDNEFASLTPIGELAIKANSKEFALIWEHQKIKMISQPVTVEFPSINNCTQCDLEKFKLNYSPYLSILKCLKIKNKIGARFYDRILARTNNDNIDMVLNNYDLFNENINVIYDYINTFNLRSETKPEDFEKEIKKYMLGIRSDLSKDYNCNYFGCVSSSTNNEWIVTNSNKLDKLLKIYEQIEKYKLNRYKYLFDDCSKELRNKYYSSYSNNTYKMNHRIKMSWDLYNIQKEVVIMTSLLITDFIMWNNITIENINYNELYDYVKLNFSSILKSLNLNNKRDIVNKLKTIVEGIKNNTLMDIDYEKNDYLERSYVNEYSSLNTDDLIRRMKEVSAENVKPSLERKRDSRIINLIHSYYLIKYSDENHLIKCECCGKTTFIKNNDEPYIEYHHLIPFSIANGPDHYENIFGICPTCHRKIHSIKDSFKDELYDEFDINNHFQKSILNRLKDLYKEHILKSYQLEYALSEYIINEEEYNLILA